MPFKTGLCSVSFRNYTPEEILIECNKAKIQYIEWGSDVHAKFNEMDNLKNISHLCEKYMVTTSSYGTYFRIGLNDICELQEYIKGARILGTDTLRIWCGTKGSSEYTKEEKNNLFDLSKRCADIAEKNNITLCLECHIWNYTDEVEAALELMNTVNSECFKMYWQPNQFKLPEENLNYAKQIYPYVKNIHVFNWKGSNKFPLIEGKDIWNKYLDYFSGDHTLLLEFMPDDKLDSLINESNALKQIAGII